MLFGIIDIGSNTIRLTVYDVDQEAKTFTTFLKFKTMAALVSYIDPKTRMMSPAGVDRLVNVLRGYLECASKFKEMSGPYAFATAGVRNAKNSKDVIAHVRKALGIKIDLIPGEEEGRLGYVGAQLQSKLEGGIHIDVGGGSTEVTVYERRKVLCAKSVPFGSLSLFDEYVSGFLPTPAEADRIRDALSRALLQQDFPQTTTAPSASGVGGSVRAARRLRDAWVDCPASPTTISLEEISQVIDHAAYDPRRSLREILQIAPERAHTCIPGVIAIQTVMRVFGATELEVLSTGVREGYLLGKVLNW